MPNALKYIDVGHYWASRWLSRWRTCLLCRRCGRCMFDPWVLGWEDPLEEGKATHSNILAGKTLWTEGPGALQSMGLQRVGHDWSNRAHTHRSSLTHKINQIYLSHKFILNTHPVLLRCDAIIAKVWDSGEIATKIKNKIHFKRQVMIPNNNNKSNSHGASLGGSVVKDSPANAGDTGSSPGPGRSHLPQGNKPVDHNYWACASAPGSCDAEACAQAETREATSGKPTPPSWLQLGKAWQQQRRPRQPEVNK